MADLVLMFAVVAATSLAIIVPFLVLPHILERRGYDPRTRFVRAIVWTAFLAIVVVPGMISGFLFTVRNVADWAILAVALTVAILYDYYRLNPGKVPWARPRT